MMDRTDRHFRAVFRRITRKTLLYTEMITAQAVLHGDREALLGFSPEEHPVALQLGGDDPRLMAEAAYIGEQFGYDEININVGCPSDRVQSGNFGACLMARPAHVASVVAAMRARVRVPVTVKHRIGIDGLERYEDMLNFVDTVSAAGPVRFTVHARIAVLGGLSPLENRTIPPLRYEDVYRLKRERPSLCVEINGGVRSLDDAEAHLRFVDGVMIGRAAVDEPWMFAEADRRFYGSSRAPVDRHAVVEGLYEYVEKTASQGLKLNVTARHLFGLFAGMRGAKAFRRHLTLYGNTPGTGANVLAEALALVPRTSMAA